MYYVGYEVVVKTYFLPFNLVGIRRPPRYMQ